MASILLWLCAAAGLPLKAGTVAAWGDNSSGQCDVPAGLSDVVAVAAGGDFSLAVRKDGTVAAWGDNFEGQCNVPAGLSGVVAVSAGKSHVLALKSDGTVVEWGSLQTDLTGLSGVVAVAAGNNHSLVLRRDGTVLEWGHYSSVPAGLSGVVAIAASGGGSLAVKSDGTVVDWGPMGSYVPSTVAGVVAISGGDDKFHGVSHNLALRNDGTVVSWAASFDNAGFAPVPAGLSDVVAVAAAGRFASLALKRDGTVVEWRGVWKGLSSNPAVPENLTGVTAIAAGGRHFLTLMKDPDQAPVILSPREAVAISGGGGFYYRIATSAPATLFSATGLPEGLTLNSATGVITGTPVQEGVFPVALSATGGSGTGEQTLTLTVTRSWGNQSPNVAGWKFDGFGGVDTRFLSDIVAVSAGYAHALALRGDGTVAVWGSSLFGNRYIGQNTVPSGLSGVTAISAGSQHSLALRNNGTVTAWGYNLAGQCDVPSGLSGVVAISAGGGHSLALKRDGTVTAWGFCTLPAGLSEVTAISAGANYSLALKRDGSVVGWHSGPPDLPMAGLSDIVAVAAGEASHSFALKRDGTVLAWNDNNASQSSVIDGLSDIVAIATGYSTLNFGDRYLLALKRDGTLVTWRRLDHGGGSIVPASVSGVVSIASGGDQALALLRIPNRAPAILSPREAVATGGSGSFYYRIVASSATTAFSASGLPEGLTLDGVTGIITGTPAQAGTFTVLLSAVNEFGTGQAELVVTVTGIPSWSGTSIPMTWTLGHPVRGQLHASGNPAWSATGLPPGTHIDPVAGTVQGAPEAPGVYHAVLTLTNRFGTVTHDWDIWVSNVAVWDSATGTENDPPAGLTLASAVAAGLRHSLALKSDGTVAAWGYNNEGQCNVPTGLSHVVAVAAGQGHSVALGNDGTVTAWGDNSNGQCTVPPGLSGVIAIAAGYNHSLALRNDHTVVAWGDNQWAQCAVPSGLSGVTALAAGQGHSVALKSDGTVVAWGGSPEQRAVPAGLSGVTAIAAGQSHSVALRGDGTVAAWGGIDFLGQNTVPANLSDVVAISGGIYHSKALKRDGTVVTWGTGGSSINLKGGVAISTGVHTLGLIGPAILSPSTASMRISQPFLYQTVWSWPGVALSADALPAGLTLDSGTGALSGTAASAGRHDIMLKVQDPITGLSGRQVLRLYVVDAGFTAWQERLFTDAGGPDARPEADPDGDGAANLLEYARGTDPLATDMETAIVPGVGAQGALEIHMDVLTPVASELEVRALFADDPAFTNPLEVSTSSAGGAPANGYQRIGFSDSSAGPHARRFGRLLISLRP